MKQEDLTYNGDLDQKDLSKEMLSKLEQEINLGEKDSKREGSSKSMVCLGEIQEFHHEWRWGSREGKYCQMMLQRQAKDKGNTGTKSLMKNRVLL